MIFSSSYDEINILARYKFITVQQIIRKYASDRSMQNPDHERECVHFYTSKALLSICRRSDKKYRQGCGDGVAVGNKDCPSPGIIDQDRGGFIRRMARQKFHCKVYRRGLQCVHRRSRVYDSGNLAILFFPLLKRE